MRSIDIEIKDRKLIDYVYDDNTGYPDDLAAEDTTENLLMMGGTEFPNELWIEPKHWKEYVADNKYDERGLWPENYRSRYTHQGGTHECTCHALIQCCEGCWNLQFGGLNNKVAFSQIGIYAIANPRQWGGANCRQVLRISMEHGLIPETIWDQDKKYEHTLHGTCGKGNENNSSGSWVTERSNPEYFDGAKSTRQRFRPTEIIIPSSREQMACLIIHGRLVGVGRRGHSIPYNRLAWEPNQRSENPTFPYPDSYDVIRYDSWSGAAASVSSSYCVWSMSRD